MICGIYNIKGGVGKTAAAVNFAYLAAREGNKSLICDFDPQAATTYYFDKKTGLKSSAKKFIKGKSDLEQLIVPTQYKNLDLLPGDFDFRNLDMLLDDVKKSKKRLRDILKPLKTHYQWIFIDAPPNISLVSENIFRAADYLLVPVIPTPLSMRTHNDIIRFFKEEKMHTSAIIPFFSMTESRKKIHKQIMTEAAKDPESNFCEKNIPYLSDIEKMGMDQKPVTYSKPASRAAQSFVMLWNEIKTKTKY